MSESRSVFSLPLLCALQAVIVWGYALRPSRYRPLAFIPILVISCYLVFFNSAGALGKQGLGAVIIIQALYAFDGIVLNDARNLCRVGEKPGQIISAPYLERLGWAWHLHNSPRGVGWAHEVANVPKNSPSFNEPGGRRAFLLARFLTVCRCVGVQAIYSSINAANPAMVPGATPLVHQPLYIRTLTMFGLFIPNYAKMNILHCLASIVLVAVGVSQPADWPPLFGSVAKLHTVQTSWGIVWHQLLRRPLLVIANFLLHTVLRLPRQSPKFPALIYLLKTTIAFFVSAFLHLAGEYMLRGRMYSGTFWFFALQPCAIAFEMCIHHFITGSTKIPNDDTPLNMMLRRLGYVWVLLWFTFVGRFLMQSMIDDGYWA